MDKLKGQFESLLSGQKGGLGGSTTPKSNFDKLNPKLVLLDVGGVHYSTTLETLTRFPESMLGRMFSGRYDIKVGEEDNRVFIDRDGTHFSYILNFLREPKGEPVKIKDKPTTEELRVEARYYGLEEYMFAVQEFTIPDNLDWFDNNKIKIHSYSSQYSGFPASNTLNPNVTYWLSEGGQITNQWIVYEFPAKFYLCKLMMKVDNFQCTAKDWVVQVSEDDECKVWENVKEFQSRCGNECQSDQNFEGFECRAKYIKLFFKNNWGPGGGSYILVTNMKFYGALLDD